MFILSKCSPLASQFLLHNFCENNEGWTAFVPPRGLRFSQFMKISGFGFSLASQRFNYKQLIKN
jgi:hypothetical protein